MFTLLLRCLYVLIFISSDSYIFVDICCLICKYVGTTVIFTDLSAVSVFKGTLVHELKISGIQYML